VLGAAIEGDPAAKAFVAHMLRKRGAIEPHATALAESWNFAIRSASQTKRSSKPGPPRRRLIASSSTRCVAGEIRPAVKSPVVSQSP
jgi:hypothetical protein